MVGKWRYYKIGGLGKVITGKTPSTKEPENFGGPYPFITIPDLGQRVYIDTSERTLSEIGASKMKTLLLPPNSVMMSCIATIGKCGITTKPSFTNQQINSVICDPNIVDPLFLYYVFTQIGNELESAGGGGSVYTNVSKSRFSEIPVLLPPLSEQRAIAAVLGALDDKIELNRRMNRTLEAIAQAVFRHWFVENEEAEGWEIRTLGDICEFAYGKGLKEEERVSGPIPVYGSNGQIGWHNECLVKGPGIVVGRKGNPGIVTWVHTDFFPIDTTFYVQVKDRETSLYWLYYTLASLNLPNLGADSAVPGLNRNFAYMSDVVYPPSDLMKRFDGIVKPLFDKIHANEQQSRTLAALRDALLPRLMRGVVRVAVHE